MQQIKRLCNFYLHEYKSANSGFGLCDWNKKPRRSLGERRGLIYLVWCLFNTLLLEQIDCSI